MYVLNLNHTGNACSYSNPAVPAQVDSPVHELPQDDEEIELSVITEGCVEDPLSACFSAISKAPVNDQIGIVSELFSKCLRRQAATMTMPEDFHVAQPTCKQSKQHHLFIGERGRIPAS